MDSNFQLWLPVKIAFGTERLLEIGKAAKEYGTRALIIIGSKTILDRKIVNKVNVLLEDNGVEVEVAKCFGTNPDVKRVEQISEKGQAFKADLLIAIGGGSAIDTAKSVSISITHDGNIWDYRITGAKSVQGIEDKLLPIITIPTISGTGSEVTPAAVLSNGTTKEVIYSPCLFPKLAIVDPSLTTTLPIPTTAQTGFDAYIQAVEAFVSTGSHPISQLFAGKCARICVNTLPEVIKNPKDVTLREKIAIASILSGFSISLAGVGAIHALSTPLSGHYHVHHGLSLAPLALPVMRFNIEGNEKKYVALAKVLGAETEKLEPREASTQVLTITELLLKEIDMYPPPRLSEFGFKTEDLATLLEEALNPDIQTNPRKMPKQQIKEIYSSII